MSRILLDENVPVGVIKLLSDHVVRHVHDEGWTGLSNGALITAAEKAGFTVLVTADQNLAYQQNLVGRRLALVVLPSNNWRFIQRNLSRVRSCVDRASEGTYEVVAFDVDPNR